MVAFGATNLGSGRTMPVSGSAASRACSRSCFSRLHPLAVLEHLARQTSAGVAMMDCAAEGPLLQVKLSTVLLVCDMEYTTTLTSKVACEQSALRTSLQVGRPSSAAISETSKMKNLHAEGASLPLSISHAPSAPSWPARLSLCCPLSRGLLRVSLLTAWAQLCHHCAIFGR